MKKFSKVISSLMVLCLLVQVFPIIAYADTLVSGFEGFTLNNASISTDGILTVSGGDASAAKSVSLPASYIIDFSIKIAGSSPDSGGVFGNKDARVYMMLNPTSINITGGSIFNYNLGTDWNDFSFEVNGNSASLYINDQYVGDTVVPNPEGRPSDRVSFHATGSTVEVSDLTVVTSVTKDEKSKASDFENLVPTPAFTDNFDGTNKWTFNYPFRPDLSGYKTSEETGRDLYVSSVAGGRKGTASMNFVPSKSFELEFRMKYTNNTVWSWPAVWLDYGYGLTVIWFLEEYYSDAGQIYISSTSSHNDADAVMPIRNPNDWHNYRLVVDEREYFFYIDGECVVKGDAQPSVGTPCLEFRTECDSTDNTDFTVDWIKYTPREYNLDILPMDGSEVLEGADVNFSASYCGKGEAPEYVNYVSNGIVIGKGQAPDYKFVWENVPYGNHSVNAEWEDSALSRPSIIKTIPRFGGEIKSAAYNNNNVVVSATTFHEHSDAYVKEVDYRIGGKVYKQTNKDENFALSLGKLPMGVYKVQTEFVDSNEFRIEEDGRMEVLPINNEGANVGLEYKVSYDVANSGNILASDGNFLLDVSHTATEMKYKSDKGELTLPLTGGSYSLAIRSGVAEITRNGHFEGSFNLPLNDEIIPMSYTGVANLNLDVIDKDMIVAYGNGDTEVALKDVSDTWSLEFEKTGTNPENIIFKDGGYILDMTIGTDISISTIPAGNYQDPGRGKEQIKTVPVPNGRHIYRITCDKGLAQLFIDNVFALSLRLPEVKTPAYLSRSGSENDAFLVLKEIEDEWTFAEDFENTKTVSPIEYWDGNAEITTEKDDNGNCLVIKNGTAVVNGFMKNPVINAKVKVDTAFSGSMWMNLRYITDIVNMMVGYNAETGCWEISKIHQTKTTLASVPGSIPKGKWFDISLKTDEDIFVLYINGEKMLSAQDDSFSCNGKVGFRVENGEIRVDDFSVTGNGRVTAGVKRLPGNPYPQEFLRLNDGSTLMMGYNGVPTYKATDGLNFVMTDITQLGMNTIRLQNGDVLTIKTMVENEKGEYHSEAWISPDDCKTFEGPYIIENEQGVESNSFTCENGKLEQGKDGRIYYTSAESLPKSGAQENASCDWLFYSDDGGRTWTRSSNPNYSVTSGYLGAESKAIELPDGTIRVYCRSNTGFLRYLDSSDRGETLPQDNMVDSQLPSPAVAYGITPDPDEENTYYAVWVYDNTHYNKYKFREPRFRISVAVSYDACKTWEFVTDLLSFDLENDGVLSGVRCANSGIRVFDDYIYISSGVIDIAENETYNNIMWGWRIDKSMIRSQKRFPLFYAYEPENNREPVGYYNEQIDLAYVQAAQNSNALLFGKTVNVTEAEAGLISAKAAALYLGAELEVSNNKVKLSANGKDLTFTIGSQNADINGQSYNAQKACVSADAVPADAIGKAFGVQVYSDSKYTILSGNGDWTPNMLEKAYCRLTEAVVQNENINLR